MSGQTSYIVPNICAFAYHNTRIDLYSAHVSQSLVLGYSRVTTRLQIKSDKLMIFLLWNDKYIGYHNAFGVLQF